VENFPKSKDDSLNATSPRDILHSASEKALRSRNRFARSTRLSSVSLDARSSRDFYQTLLSGSRRRDYRRRFLDDSLLRLAKLCPRQARVSWHGDGEACFRNGRITAGGMLRANVPMLVAPLGKSPARTRWHGLANDPREATGLSDLCRGVNP
jgi:hypothetical protein